MAEEEKIAEQTEQIPVINEKKGFKKPPLKTILISIIALLVILLIVGISLIIFSPKEEAIVETNEPVAQEEVSIEKEPEVKFDLSNINSQKINDQLASLTNKNLPKEPDIVENEESRRVLEEQKRIEEESLKIEEALVLKQKESLEEKKAELEAEMQKLEALKQEAILAKEELLDAKNKNLTPAKNSEIEEPKNEDEKLEETNDTIKNSQKEETNTKNNGDFLQLINVAKIKGVLYKKYLDKATKLDSNILLCRDDLNRIELYYGPFTSEEQREVLLNRLLKNGFSQAYGLEMTKEEFDKRCNY